jgi:hypothetical protein
MTANPCEICKAVCTPDCPFIENKEQKPTCETYTLRFGRVANLGNYESCRVVIVVTLGFRRAYQKAANWLRKAPWSSLFLGLPVESEPFVKAYAEQKVDEKEFWSSMALLTGHGKPFINSLTLRFQPILDCIRDMYAGNREIHCFQDLKSYVEENKIQERMLLLQFRHRATGKLDLSAWKNALLEEMKASKESWRRATDRILEEAKESGANAILHGGYLESTE